MANGRLAHVSVPANSYATIYTNSSGSQASVSLVADGTAAGTLSFRISEDASPAFTSDTTVVSESYTGDKSNILINATTTAVTDRLQWPRTGNTVLNAVAWKYNDTTVYRLGDTVSGAYSSSNNFNKSTTRQFSPYEVFQDPQNSLAIASPNNGLFVRTTNGVWKFQLTGGVGETNNIRSRADYYYRMVTYDDNTGIEGEAFRYEGDGGSNSYYDVCLGVTEPYMKELGFYYGNSDEPLTLGVSMNQQGYMSCSVARATSSTTGSFIASNSNRTSNSFAYTGASGSNFPQPTNTNSRPTVRISGGLITIDPCDYDSGSNYRVSCRAIVADDGNYAGNMASPDTQYIGSSASPDTGAGSFGFNYAYFNWRPIGGNVIYNEWDVLNNINYLCLRTYFGNSYATKLYKIDRKACAYQFGSSPAVSNVNRYISSPNSIPSIWGNGGVDGEPCITDITSSLSLSWTNTAVSTAAVTYRVQRTKASEWVIIAYNESNQQTDVRVSTDLKVWKTYAAEFSPNDYQVPALNDTSVLLRHDNNTLFFTSDNFQNISTDGILENNTEMKHYTRTGLVLSDGDKIICQNTGDTAMSVQVFGYEG